MKNTVTKIAVISFIFLLKSSLFRTNVLNRHIVESREFAREILSTVHRTRMGYFYLETTEQGLNVHTINCDV